LPLATFGTVEQKQRWLAPLATGTHIGAFGLTDGSNAVGIRTQARQADSGWILNDTKMLFISNAGTEMNLGVTVLAVTGSDDNGRKRYGTFFVPEGTDGYTKGQPLRKLGWHALDTRELVFTDRWLPHDHLIAGGCTAGLAG
jgi:alkylation response protein AidB-like acyl-CoA dehydrogenase